MVKGKVLKIFDSKAAFENLDTDACLVVSQAKENGARIYEKAARSQVLDLGSSPQVVPFEAIFGIYDLLSGAYVALVVESESYVSLGTISIRKAKKTLVVPLFKNGRLLSDSKQNDENRYLQLLHMAFTEHQFFFSHSYDLTLTQQRLAKLQPAQLSDPHWTTADHRFFWNYDVVLDLISVDASEWVVPFMSAYIEVRPDCLIESIKFTVLFISRRSRYRQGCRFTKRGLDQNGSAANFVETEQVVIFPDGKLCSYVQVRGSIPVKWCSPVHMRYDPKVFVDEDRHLSALYAEKHFGFLLDKYSDSVGESSVIFLNLVDNKKDQAKLGVAFANAVEDVAKASIPAKKLSYVWFDFHHECSKKGKWNNLSKLVEQVDERFRSQQYFCQLPTGQVVSWQRGVIRTNCMDNLDRTNVVQSLFARRSLLMQMGKLEEAELAAKKAKKPAVLESPYASFEKIFKNIWANNANAMSMGYAGTGALKVDFTRTGKRTLKGKFNDGVNSCMRYYINNFTDGVKQDSIDLLIGNYRPDPFGPSPFGVRSSHESLSKTVTKAFVLMMIIFSTLLLLLPPAFPETTTTTATTTTKLQSLLDLEGLQPLGEEIRYSGGEGSGNGSALLVEANVRHLRGHLLFSAAITLLTLMFIAFKVIKKGSKIGELMVVHPELCPEPLPVERQ